MASIKGQVFNMIDSNFSPGQDKRNDKFDESMEKTSKPLSIREYCLKLRGIKQ